VGLLENSSSLALPRKRNNLVLNTKYINFQKISALEFGELAVRVRRICHASFPGIEVVVDLFLRIRILLTVPIKGCIEVMSAEVSGNGIDRRGNHKDFNLDGNLIDSSPPPRIPPGGKLVLFRSHSYLKIYESVIVKGYLLNETTKHA